MPGSQKDRIDQKKIQSVHKRPVIGIFRKTYYVSTPQAGVYQTGLVRHLVARIIPHQAARNHSGGRQIDRQIRALVELDQREDAIVVDHDGCRLAVSESGQVRIAETDTAITRIDITPANSIE